MNKMDVIIIGAGAAGLMCAIEAGKRGRSVLVIDHANKPGKKILMSGGGRCNFTNLNIIPEDYISHNKHFCKSALGRFTAADFVELVNKYQIKFHEKTLGQLFCDDKSSEIVHLLLKECEAVRVAIYLETTVEHIGKLGENNFKIQSNRGEFQCQSLVIATGGLSIPTMGASPFGYKIAEKFGIKIWPTRAGLVPFTLQPEDKETLSPLSGVAVNTSVNYKQHSFSENILFTHRGLSGPAILQISSYWQPGDEVNINLLPNVPLVENFKLAQRQEPNKQLRTWMVEYLPKRVVDTFLNPQISYKTLHSVSLKEIESVMKSLRGWTLKPNGTEGYRTAEVTVGGVDCDALSSKTMECQGIRGLYFIGEVVDVTGWLGGYNFQWAWSSGWAAGQVV